jgi:nucleoside-diphosphate-sugar epimerase
VSTLIIGCGYLGERLAAILGRGGEQVFGTVRSEARALKIAAQGILPVIADVLDRASLRGLPTAERVFYCVGFDRSAGSSMRSVYVDGLLNVLDNLPLEMNRFVYASSTGVFGQTDGEWVDEKTPPEPRTESGTICLEAEEQMAAFAQTRNRANSVVVLRFAGLYGPDRVVRRQLVEKGDPIPGDPSKLLNLVHIDDAAGAAAAALRAAAPDPIYLVSDDRPVTRREYYSLIAKLLDAPSPRFVPPGSGNPDVGRDATSKRVANQRMKAGLGVELIYPDISNGLPAALGAGSKP